MGKTKLRRTLGLTRTIYIYIYFNTSTRKHRAQAHTALSAGAEQAGGEPTCCLASSQRSGRASGAYDTEQGASVGAQALRDAAIAPEAARAELRLERLVCLHVGELGEPLHQLVRLGLGEAVVGGVEVVVDGVEVGAVHVVGCGEGVVMCGSKVCDACVVAALGRGVGGGDGGGGIGRVGVVDSVARVKRGETGRAGVDVLVGPRCVRAGSRVARGREAAGNGVGGGGEGRKSRGRCGAGSTEVGWAVGRAGIGQWGSWLLVRGAV